MRLERTKAHVWAREMLSSTRTYSHVRACAPKWDGVTKVNVAKRKRTGPSWPKSHAGGASAALRYRQGANLGLQGFAVCGPPADERVRLEVVYRLETVVSVSQQDRDREGCVSQLQAALRSTEKSRLDKTSLQSRQSFSGGVIVPV